MSNLSLNAKVARFRPSIESCTGVIVENGSDADKSVVSSGTEFASLAVLVTSVALFVPGFSVMLCAFVLFGVATTLLDAARQVVRRHKLNSRTALTTYLIRLPLSLRIYFFALRK